MGELARVNENANLIGLFHASELKNSIPQPFERDIFLFATRVAGTMYNENIKETVEQLSNGSRLNFIREPKNKYDELAIVIKTVDGEKIGYVPRRDNPVFARLMDAGKELFGRVKEIYTSDYSSYIDIEIEIYLHED